MNAHTKQQQDKVFRTDFTDSQKSDPPFAHLLALSHLRTTQVINIKLVSLKSDVKDLYKYIKSDSQLLIYKITLDYLLILYRIFILYIIIQKKEKEAPCTAALCY